MENCRASDQSKVRDKSTTVDTIQTGGDRNSVGKLVLPGENIHNIQRSSDTKMTEHEKSICRVVVTKLAEGMSRNDNQDVSDESSSSSASITGSS
jgi:hypothetical protein